uniref:hypothetical protein n=1 Tax=Chromobacterium amazonense TaxID=1382803 RepID=UPI003F7A0022
EHSMAPVPSRGHLFIRPDRPDNTIENPEMATGYVCAIHFASASLDLRRPEQPEPEETFATKEEVQAAPPEDPVATAVAVLGARVEQMRGTVKWVGGLIAVALLLVAFR